MRARSSCSHKVKERNQVLATSTGRSQAAVSRHHESANAARVGTQDRFASRASVVTGLLPRGSCDRAIGRRADGSLNRKRYSMQSTRQDLQSLAARVLKNAA